MGFLEVVGVASILPFMQLIAEPDAINQSSLLTDAYNFFSFSSHKQMLISFGVGIIILIGLTNIFAVFTTWLQYKYSWTVAHNLSTRLLKIYMNKPYSYFLNTNTSKLRAYIISEVNSLTGGVIIPIIELFSRVFIAVTIFILLLKVDVLVSMVMFCGLGGAYLIIYLSQKNILKRIGKYRIKMNLLRFKSLQELLDGIKTVMVYNRENFFYDRFHHASEEFCDVQPKYNLILATPKYILEFLAFGSILSITIYFYVKSGDIQSNIPRLSLYAVAGYRLLPALQKAFAAAAKLRHNFPVLDNLYDDLVLSLNYPDAKRETIQASAFDDSIQLKDISFSYAGNAAPTIHHLNLNIKKGETIAFIGSTGSGKTTLIDLLVGLVFPTTGSITVDGKEINRSNIKSWRENIAYVSQEVFLFDDTVLRNIAIDAVEDVDFERLEKAAQMADIHEFIKNELPEGYATKIGEKGVRLSGGQRQRLGLARALYVNPSILILDEATSALDSITEKGIINSLKLLPKNMTTIIIAHRLSTIRHADCIYFLNEGTIADQGNYESLIETSSTFKTMVKLS